MAVGYKIISWTPDVVMTKATNANYRAMVKAASLVKRTVVDSFGTGASRADVSYRRTKSGKRHRPSAPGFPPNIDTGTLKNRIDDKVEVRRDRINGFVFTANVKYALPLELGTVKMQPRPFMRPALRKNHEKIEQLFKEANS